MMADAILQALLDMLVRQGNEMLGSGWENNKDGYTARLKQPIDFRLIAREYPDLPEYIELYEDDDTIVCRQTWSAIYGPNAGA